MKQSKSSCSNINDTGEDIEKLKNKVQQLHLKLNAIWEIWEESSKSHFDLRNYRTNPTKSTDGYGCIISFTIDNILEKLSTATCDTSIWSPKFRAMGVPQLQLEFFPRAQNDKKKDLCGLFLWAPKGYAIRYTLLLNNYHNYTDFEYYGSAVGTGRRELCSLKNNINWNNNTITIGVLVQDAFHASSLEDAQSQAIDDLENFNLCAPVSEGVLRIFKKQSLEYSNISGNTNIISKYCLGNRELIDHYLSVERSRLSRTVSWTIKAVDRVIKNTPEGLCLFSPEFALSGIPSLFLEFFPNGCSSSKLSGYCSLFLRGPPGLGFRGTFTVGSYTSQLLEGEIAVGQGIGLSNLCPLAAEINNINNILNIVVKIYHEPDESDLITKITTPESSSLPLE